MGKKNEAIFVASIYCLVHFFSGCASMSSKSKDKETAALHLEIGVGYLKTHAYQAALRELLIAQDLDSINPAVQNSIGVTYFIINKYPLAAKHLHNAVELDPKYTEARNNLGRTLIELNNYEEADKELNIVLNDFSYDEQDKANVNLGTMHFRKGNYLTAQEFFSKAIKLNRNNCLAHSYYGRVFYNIQQYQNAASSLDRAIEICQTVSIEDPYYYSAMSYYKMGLKEKGRVRFEEILALYPNGKYYSEAKTMIKKIKENEL